MRRPEARTTAEQTRRALPPPRPTATRAPSTHEFLRGTSFYGHLGSVTVAEGEVVAQGDPIATVLDWAAEFGPQNSHLHYVMLSADLCAASDAAGGSLICGYDDTAGPNGIETLDDEPYSYTSVGDPCGTQAYPDAFISPSQFIATHG